MVMPIYIAIEPSAAHAPDGSSSAASRKNLPAGRLARAPKQQRQQLAPSLTALLVLRLVPLVFRAALIRLSHSPNRRSPTAPSLRYCSLAILSCILSHVLSRFPAFLPFSFCFSSFSCSLCTVFCFAVFFSPFSCLEIDVRPAFSYHVYRTA